VSLRSRTRRASRRASRRTCSTRSPTFADHRLRIAGYTHRRLRMTGLRSRGRLEGSSSDGRRRVLPNKRMKLTAPLGGRAVTEAWSRPPHARHSARTGAAAYPRCSTDIRRARAALPSGPDFARPDDELDPVASWAWQVVLWPTKLGRVLSSTGPWPADLPHRLARPAFPRARPSNL